MYFEESTLREQISELEDLYAECLLNQADGRDLDGIWLLIKELQLQLTQARNYMPSPLRTPAAVRTRH